MKNKYFIYGIFMLFILTSTMLSIRVEGASQQQETIIIRVGVYTNDSVSNCGITSYSGPDKAFPYTWEVEDKKYIIIAEEIRNYYLLNLLIKNPKNINVIIIDGALGPGTWNGLPIFEWLPEFQELELSLEKFISEGGGYIGNCGGTVYALDLFYSPRTTNELVDENDRFLNNPMDNNVLDVKTHYRTGAPIIDEWLWLRKNIFPLWNNLKPHAEYIGCSSWQTLMINLTSCEANGVPFNFEITEKDHPIFKGYNEDTFLARWAGGPAIKIPHDDNDDIVGLAYYTPEEDLSSNQYTSIEAWGSRPGILLLKQIFNVLKPGNYDDSEEFAEAFDYILDLINNLKGWIHLDTKVEEGHNHEAALVAIDNYKTRDEDEGGRLVLFGGHPTATVWDRKTSTHHIYIARAPATGENTLHTGLYRWMDDMGTWKDKSDDVPRYTISGSERPAYLEWLVRREVAWASGEVPDNHMPPIDKSSEVSIGGSPLQSQIINVKGMVGENNNIMETWESTNLSLYYQYNGTNSNYTLTNWTYYTSDYEAPWEFSFNSDNAYGDGEYSFCTILNTTNASEEYTCEDFPPYRDTYCYVGVDTIADYQIGNPTPYINEQISLNDQSLSNLNIISWSWDLGDGNTSSSQNVTHQYTMEGTYNISLNVTDNESNYHILTKNIEVHNNPPNVNFNSTPFIVIGPSNGQNNDENPPVVFFESSSSDPDGSIVNWSWNFGDNNMGYGDTFNHSYSESGYYPVTLTVTDDDNTTREKILSDHVLVANALVNGSLLSDDPGNYTWMSIQNALDNLSTFDILYVLNNTYNENIIINKSVIFLGENQDGVIINGSVTMVNPHDHELINLSDNDGIANMSGSNLLFHFNNDSNVGENYSCSGFIFDYSENGNNGSSNGAIWTTNTLKGAGAFNFNGSDNSINLSCIPALTSENVSVSAWIYWSEGTGSYDPILSQSNTTQGYCLYINNTNSTPVFQLGETKAISSKNLSNGWHHVVGTHNGSSSLLKIYVDGVARGEANKTGSGINYIAFIGYNNLSDWFNGTIDEVAVWNRTLSDDEISRMYHGNWGSGIYEVTIQNADKGVIPCNHSIIGNCLLNNNTIGAYLNDSMDVIFDKCNFTGGNYGILLLDSNPDSYNRIIVGDCIINDSVNGFIANSSSMFSVYNSYFNCSSINMSFNDCNFSSIYVISSTSLGNVAPDVPCKVSGSTLGDINTSYTYSTLTNDSDDEQLLYLFDWGDGNDSGWLGPFWSNESVNSSHSWAVQGGYYIKVKAKDVFYNESNWSETLLFKTETLPPLINSVNNTSGVVGFGGSINITANVTDDQSGNHSGIQNVTVNVSYPNNTSGNFTMKYIGNDTYQYVFNDTWLVGQYNYSIWAVDNAYNYNSSSGYSFNVSSQAVISVCTLKDNYSDNEYINITDPPGPSSSYNLVGRSLMWNEYYNASSGRNVLEVYTSPVNYQDESGNWTTIDYNISLLNSGHPAYGYGYWSGNEHGLYNAYFKPDTQDSWPVAFAYDKSTDPDDHIIRSKLVGVGYLDPSQNWSYKYLQNVKSSQGQINGDSVTYENVFSGTDLVYSYGNIGLKEEIIMSNTTKTLLLDNPPSEYGLSNQDSYLVFITRLDYQNLNLYNSTGILTGNFTISDGWIDFKDNIGLLKCAMPVGEAFELNNVSVRQCLTYRVIQYNNNYYLLSGLKIEDLNNMTFPIVIDPTLNVYSNQSDGHILKEGSSYATVQGAASGMSRTTDPTLSIGQKYNPFAPPGFGYSIWRGFVFFDTSLIPSNDLIDSAVLSLYKDGDFSVTDFDIVIQNGQPTYPYEPLRHEDYNKNYYSGDGGSLSTVIFSSGYNNISLTNLSWININGTTKLCLRSSRDISSTTPTGNEYVTVCSTNYPSGRSPKLVVEYRNQSKIKNTGSTDISGYLLMQVQFYNGTCWVVADDTVNETTLRTINMSEQFGLDLVFNGLVTTDDLSSFGNGTYRIYAAFRDPDGNILKCDDETELVATYEFTITFD